MPPNEGAPSLSFATRAYSYDVGEVGPVVARQIAVETPIEIRFGGAPFAVMMATPADLEDFAIGFALSEGVIERLGDIRAVEARLEGVSGRVDVALSGERMSAHLARKRAMSGRTGCGVCGIEDLAHLPKAPRRKTPSPAPSPRAIGAALRALESAQPLNALTRAVHAAAWCGADGAIRCVREDVGRHNALDKLIGALLRESVDPDDGFILITSRCSFEMVAKAAAFGAGVLVSVSAPTSFALRTAQASGVALIAVARNDHALAFIETNSAAPNGAAA